MDSVATQNAALTIAKQHRSYCKAGLHNID